MHEPLRLYVGSDHGGFLSKQLLMTSLAAENVEMRDVGTYGIESVDYPEYALKVTKEVLAHPGSFGVLLCRSGEGMQMAANKVPGIRAALAWNKAIAAETRADNDANVLVLPADFLSQTQITAIVRRFLATPFSELPRHQRRITELTDIEKHFYGA